MNAATLRSRLPPQTVERFANRNPVHSLQSSGHMPKPINYTLHLHHSRLATLLCDGIMWGLDSDEQLAANHENVGVFALGGFMADGDPARMC